MNDTLLQVSIDGRVHRLRNAWADGRPGSLTDIYDLALLHTEAVMRGFGAGGPLPPQLFSGDGDEA